MTALSVLRDDRPEFRVAVFGLATRFRRMLEIVLRHARHNPYRYSIAESGGPGAFDVALIDMRTLGAPNLFDKLARVVDRDVLVRLGRRCDPSRQQDDLLVQSFVAQVLFTLNRVVDLRLSRLPAPGVVRARMPAGGRPAQPLAAKMPTPVAPIEMIARPRVLAIDDNPTVRRQLSAALHQWGIDCEALGCARRAMSRLEEVRFGLVLADVAMPELDGYRLTRIIRKDRRLRDTPVVLLGNRASAIDLARGALAGCSAYLVKPVTMQSLRLTVGRHLDRERLSL